MGVLNSTLNTLTGGLLGGSQSVNPPSFVQDDFVGGFVITEIVDGKEDVDGAVRLDGPFTPHRPFRFGGEQKLVKNYYAGSKEPTVQVLGPRESDTTITGRLKSKRFKDERLRTAARAYQELLDNMRLRGNLVKITWGDEWTRYAFVEKVEFELETLAEINYSVQFSVVGFDKPTNCKFVDDGASNIEKPNQDLKNLIDQALADITNIPTSMPQSLADQIAGWISDVAGVMATVTGFVDGILADPNNLLRSANRALGLIKYARAYVSSRARLLGNISLAISNLGSSFSDEAQKTAATVKNIDAIYRNKQTFVTFQQYLVALQAQFAALARTVPLMRHLVVDGDNLQRLAIKYYNNADLWKKIYDHNKLRTTDLEVGKVLEIPRL